MATSEQFPVLRDARLDIDGVAFQGVDMDTMTFAHHVYLEEVMAGAGLDDPAQFMSRDAVPRANAKALMLALYRSDRTFDWLAGVLVEVGQQWTKQSAVANAQRFARATSKASITALQQLVAESLVGFFVAGLGSFGISPSSIPSPAAAESPTSSDPSTSSAAAPSDAEHGTPSSADSPATTTTA